MTFGKIVYRVNTHWSTESIFGHDVIPARWQRRCYL